MDNALLKRILEAALFAASQPLSLAQLGALFGEEETPSRNELGRALEELKSDCADRGVELVEVATGYRYQVRQECHTWVSRMWSERPQRYSRALLETLSLIAYRQPVTRGEIEQVRGVGVSSGIVRTLEEREWIRVVGYRDVPGKPALFGTTKAFLDYFNLKSLDELPSLAEIRDLESFDPQLQLDDGLGRVAQLPATKEAEAVAQIQADPADDSDAQPPEPPLDEEQSESSPDDAMNESDFNDQPDVRQPQSSMDQTQTEPSSDDAVVEENKA